jgi:hypothetical protein
VWWLRSKANNNMENSGNIKISEDMEERRIDLKNQWW